MPTNAPDSSGPAAPRCPRCAQPMRLVRRTPRFGGLPDLYTFECRSCEISHTEEGGPARWRDTDLFRLFSKQARECRRLATLAQDSEDRSFWLRLSEHWLKLAQGTGQPTSYPLTQLTTGALQVGLKGTMNALDLTDRRQKMWRVERQSGHFHTLGVACI